MVVLFILEKNIGKKTIQAFLCLYAPRSCMNTWIHLGMMFVICSSIRMRIKIYCEFYHCIIYITNEGRHVRIDIFNGSVTELP